MDNTFLTFIIAETVTILGAIGAFIWKGKEATNATITTLSKEVERLTTANEKLLTLGEKQVQVIVELKKDVESSLEELKQTNIQLQKLNNELSFYKIKK